MCGTITGIHLVSILCHYCILPIYKVFSVVHICFITGKDKELQPIGKDLDKPHTTKGKLFFKCLMKCVTLSIFCESSVRIKSFQLESTQRPIYIDNRVPLKG